MRWFTYVYYDEVGMPTYVGKGTSDRAFNRNAHGRIKVPPKDRIRIKYFDTEEQSYEHEKNLIAFWGRKGIDDRGLLDNRSTGGPGAPGVPCSAKLLKLLEAGRRKGQQSRVKEFYVTPPGGEEFKIRNMSKFCMDKDLDSSGMIKVARGTNKSCKGWKVRYA